MPSRCSLVWIFVLLLSVSCSKNEPEKPDEAAPPALVGEPSEEPEPQPDPRRNAAAGEPQARPPAERTGSAPAGRPSTKRPEAPPRVSESEPEAMVAPQWLDRSEVRMALSYQGMLEIDGIVGQSRAAGYQAERLKTADPSQFGVGLQVWKGNNPPKRYDDLFRQSWGGGPSKDVGDSSFRTEHHRLRELTFLDRKRNLVAILTCDVELCTFDQLVELARRLQPRL